MAKYLVSHPCQDACGTIETDRNVNGAPIYLCPGCDSEWYEPREQSTVVDDRQPLQQQVPGVAEQPKTRIQNPSQLKDEVEIASHQG